MEESIGKKRMYQYVLIPSGCLPCSLSLSIACSLTIYIDLLKVSTQ